MTANVAVLMLIFVASLFGAFFIFYFSSRSRSGAQSDPATGLAGSLNDRLDQFSERINTSLGDLSLRLALIEKAGDAVGLLHGEVSGLKSVLSNRQARGAFGETQLKDIVSSLLPPSAFDFQQTLSNNARVDCLVHFPGPPGDIGIDSKFPLEAYAALVAAETDSEREAARRQFRTDIQKHIQDIASKYIIPGETADSAMMFLPSEAVYAEIHTSFRDLVEKSHQARVWIVSPTTLMAILTTMRAVMTDAVMIANAPKLRKLAGSIAADAERLTQRIQKLSSHLDQAEADIKAVTTSADSIVRRCNRLADLEVGADDEVASA